MTDQVNDPADPGKNNPATLRDIVFLAVYLVVVTVFVVFGLYRLWPRCEPVPAQAGDRPAEARHFNTPTPPPITLTPESGPIEGKNLVTIIGSGFATGTTVTFGTEVIQPPAESLTSTSIVVTAPAHAAGPVAVNVKRKPGDPDAVAHYWYVAAPLSVTTVTPNSGLVGGGTPVNIIGTGFVGEVKIRFGGIEAMGVALNSDTSITASLPARSAGKVDVVVENGDGKVIVKDEAFTYTCPGTPEFRMLLLIICAGALGGCLHAMRSLADFAGSRQLLQSWRPYYFLLPLTSLMIALIFYLIVRAGLFNPESSTADKPALVLAIAALVGLFSEAAMEKLKKIAIALFTEPPPRPDKLDKAPPLDLQRLSAVTGKTKGGDTVIVEGRGFSDTAEVTFDGLKATVVSRTGDTSITVTTPPHAAGPVDVEVLNASDKTSKLAGGFTYEEAEDESIDEEQPGPGSTITGVNPNKGPASGNTVVKIDGTGFDAKAVQFGGIAATDVSGTAELISATTPAHDPGSVDIVVTNKDDTTATLEGGFTYE